LTKKPTDERIATSYETLHEPTDEPTLEPIAKPIDNWAIVSITLSIADSIDEPIHLLWSAHQPPQYSPRLPSFQTG